MFSMSATCSAQTIAVWGDSQGNFFDRFTTHVRHMALKKPDYVIGLGDYVQDGRTEEWRPQLVTPLLSGFSAPSPKDGVFVHGNHDAQWFDYFGPVYGFSLYAKTWGPVRIVVLDSGLVKDLQDAARRSSCVFREA